MSNAEPASTVAIQAHLPALGRHWRRRRRTRSCPWRRADGQAAAVAAQSALSAVEPGPIADSLVVETLARQIADVAARARERMDRLGDIDAASQDVLTDVVRSLEEQLWMVRAQHAPAGSN